MHIIVYTSFIGKERITIDDFVNISSRVSIYSSNDNFLGDYMTNPTINKEFTNVAHGDVFVGKYDIIGSGSINLPNVTLNQGACVSSLFLIENY